MRPTRPIGRPRHEVFENPHVLGESARGLLVVPGLRFRRQALLAAVEAVEQMLPPQLFDGVVRAYSETLGVLRTSRGAAALLSAHPARRQKPDSASHLT